MIEIVPNGIITETTRIRQTGSGRSVTVEELDRVMEDPSTWADLQLLIVEARP